MASVSEVRSCDIDTARAHRYDDPCDMFKRSAFSAIPFYRQRTGYRIRKRLLRGEVLQPGAPHLKIEMWAPTMPHLLESKRINSQTTVNMPKARNICGQGLPFAELFPILIFLNRKIFPATKHRPLAIRKTDNDIVPGSKYPGRWPRSWECKSTTTCGCPRSRF